MGSWKSWVGQSPSLPVDAPALPHSLNLSRPALPLPPVHRLMKVMWGRDPELLAHGLRAAGYAWTLGRAIGLPSTQLLHVHYAAVLHDVGKLALPESILRKDGPLTSEEYASLQCHPRDGARILESISGLRKSAVLIAHHHEHWDGSGYPYGLRGTYIPLGSRVLAVADRFDALSSGKDGCTRDGKGAMKFLRMLAGSQLDPMVVEAFCQDVTTEFLGESAARPLGGAPRSEPSPPTHHNDIWPNLE
jgi:response regulator RpfG family c-di-GMP phosphodiesterase